jgi:general secretion pathway protein H
VKDKHAGMTLLEIVVAFAVMALLMMIVVPSIESYSGVNVREEAGRISGAIRFMYGESALSGRVCRLVFDIDQRYWWAECSSANYTVAQQNGAFLPDTNDSVKEKGVKTNEFLDEAEELRAKIEKKAEFAQFQDEEISKRKLPENTRLSIWTSHQKEKIKKGQAFLYFFPQGNTERAHITISGQYGDSYTLAVSPLTGRVRVVDGELSVPHNGG